MNYANRNRNKAAEASFGPLQIILKLQIKAVC